MVSETPSDDSERKITATEIRKNHFKLPRLHKEEEEGDLLGGHKKVEKPKKMTVAFGKKPEEKADDTPSNANTSDAAAGDGAPLSPKAEPRRLGLKNIVGAKDDGYDSDSDKKKAQREKKRAAKPVVDVAKEKALAAAAEKRKRVGVEDELHLIRTAEWFYLDKEGAYKGPFSADDLKDMYDDEKNEEVNDSTFVWAKDVLDDWMMIQTATPFYAFLLNDPTEQTGAKKTKKEKKKDAKDKKKAEANPTAWFDLGVNTSVYITNLPDDATVEEMMEFFKKVGIIKIDPVTKQHKIKLYGKNDGLVTFLRRESVDLAIKLLDGAVFREHPKQHRVHVEEAKFEMKGSEYKPKKDLKQYNKEMKKAKKQLSAKLGWYEGDSDPNLRTVVLKNMFHPDDFRQELNLAQTLKKEIGDEAAKIGSIERVKVIPNSVDGVTLVTFRSFIHAQQCIEKFNGRLFGGKTVEAYMWDHKEKFDMEEYDPTDDHGRGFGTAADEDDSSMECD